MRQITKSMKLVGVWGKSHPINNWRALRPIFKLDNGLIVSPFNYVICGDIATDNVIPEHILDEEDVTMVDLPITDGCVVCSDRNKYEIISVEQRNQAARREIDNLHHLAYGLWQIEEYDAAFNEITRAYMIQPNDDITIAVRLVLAKHLFARNLISTHEMNAVEDDSKQVEQELIAKASAAWKLK